jgi:hypothetical protein
MSPNPGRRPRRFREYLCPIRGKWYVKDGESDELPTEDFPGRTKAREYADAKNAEVSNER